MNVYAKRMAGSKIENIPIEQDLGIEIVHEGKSFRVHLDNHGSLIISGNDQLILKPKASNSFLLWQE